MIPAVPSAPNTAAQVHESATSFCAARNAKDADRAVARALFAAVGSVWEAPNEDLLDAVTGLSGSGPAYVFLILEALGVPPAQRLLPRNA